MKIENASWGAVYNFCAIGHKGLHIDWERLAESIRPAFGDQAKALQRKLLFLPDGSAREFSSACEIPPDGSAALIFHSVSIHVETGEETWNAWGSVAIAEVNLSDTDSQEILMRMWKLLIPFEIVAAGAGEELVFPELGADDLPKFNPLSIAACDCALTVDLLKGSSVIHPCVFQRKRSHLRDAYGRK
jgi:hypothetical protein